MKKTAAISDYPFAVGVPAIIWQVLFFYLPLALLFITSIIAVNAEGVFAGITFEKVAFFLRAPYFRILGYSFLMAFGNAVLCFCIAYPLAYYMAFRGSRYKNLLLFFLIVPFWTNFLLHVYAWFFVLERQGFLNNLLLWLGVIPEPCHFLNSVSAIMIMMVYYYLPFMVLPLYSAMERFDHQLIEASLDLGARWSYTFRRIILPLTARGIKTGFFLVYIPSFGEFAIPELMGGDRYMFMGTVISQFILGEGTGPLGAAFATLGCAAVVLSATLLFLALDRLLKLGCSR